MTAPRPRPSILDIEPYVGGKSAVPGVARAAKLSSNESPLGASPLVREAFIAASGRLHRYPDGSALDLRSAIAARHGLDPQRIVCGNGSDEILGLLGQIYLEDGSEAIYSEHGFLMYKIIAQANGATPVAVRERDLTADVDAILEHVSAKTRIVFIANPNNPTGTYLSAAQMTRLRDGLPGDVLLVIDAAYAEYVRHSDYEAGVGLVDGSDNVVMTRTFSKIYGLALLRLGWAYAPAPIVDLLNRVRGPFNVDGAAQAAGAAAIADTAWEADAVVHNQRWLAWLHDEISGLGFTVTPSAGNFLLVHFAAGAKSAIAADVFLQRRGLILRRLDNYGLGHCLRLTVGLEADNRALVAALKDFRDG